MCTFLESSEMALALGAVGKEEEMGEPTERTGKSTLAPFVACLSHNLENHRNGENENVRTFVTC